MTKAAPACWHCGDPLPVDDTISAPIAGQLRAFCCHGCRGAAEWIEASGLADFYRLRAAAPAWEGRGADPLPQPALASPTGLDRHLVRDLGGGTAEVMLVIDGMRCAACSWLIERLLGRHLGVASVQVNPVSQRARIVFEPARVGLATLVETIARAGYRPLPLDPAVLDDARGRESRQALKRLLVAGFGMMQAMMFASVLYVGGDDLDEGTRGLFRWLGFLAATPVVLYSALPFFRGAVTALSQKTIGLDVPVALAIALIYMASLMVAWRGGVEVYFDSVSMFVFFLLCGRHVEMRARHRACDLGDSISRLTPRFAERRRADGSLERLPAAELVAGDIVHVASGQALPADGRLLDGRCTVDESLLTGESRPLVREAGAALIAGSLVVEGPAEVEVTRVGAATTLASILTLVERAQVTRPRLARVGERAAAGFVLRVLLLSVATALFWTWQDPSRTFDAALAVLVISCPCAFALAVPAALTRALAVLARRGILVVKPDAIEALASADHALFDKTGTLTDRHLRVETVQVCDPGLDEARCLALAGALARESRHPASEAISEAARGPAVLRAQACVERRGDGIEGRVDGRLAGPSGDPSPDFIEGQCLRLGRPGFALAGLSVETRARADRALAAATDGVVCLAGPTGLLASFTLAEEARADAPAMLKRLTTLGLDVEIASGDAPSRVAAVATTLGVEDWRGGQLPADKLQRLQRLREAGRRTLVVGDGVNDAPVLAGADVSIAVAGGADLAQASSDIVLVGGRLGAVADAVTVARRTLTVLRQNQRWAMVYNFSAVPLAAAGFVPPWLAALGMSLSSLFVVLNAWRIESPRGPVGTVGTLGTVGRAGTAGTAATIQAASAGPAPASSPVPSIALSPTPASPAAATEAAVSGTGVPSGWPLVDRVRP